MVISKKEVQHIAKLARLGVSEKELAKMQKELSSILEFFEKLKEADVADVKTASQLDFCNVIRKDEAKKQEPETAAALIEAAPEKKDGYVKVKAVLK